MSDPTSATVTTVVQVHPDVQTAMVALVNDLKLDAPTAIKLLNALKTKDIITLKTIAPEVFKEAQTLKTDLVAVAPNIKTDLSTPTFWVAVAAVVGPEIENLLDKPMGSPEHIAILAVAAILYAVKHWSRVRLADSITK
jgi:hypothetical protein